MPDGVVSALSPIIRNWAHDGKEGLIFWCPGCNMAHSIRTNPDGWGYNGNPNAPTFTPSVLVTYNGLNAGIDGAPPAVCHSFVTDGKIQFLSDCTHSLAGVTVPLAEWPQ